jgi:phytoene/squalene synthetase
MCEIPQFGLWINQMDAMDRHTASSDQLAAAITWAASKQTFFTIRFFVDHDRMADAFRSYGYFRWVDDVLDAEAGHSIDQIEAEKADRIAFAKRQQSLLEACYRGEQPNDLCDEEWMLVDLVSHDTELNSGLQLYLRNMMDVMLFDSERRGQVISLSELTDYSARLAKAVTEALYYFIGHADPSPSHEARYRAVTAAHITHMLRDTFEDIDNGFFNISSEFLKLRRISPKDVNSPEYREWVRGRVQLAREYFREGRDCTAQVQNLRCRLAGCAYTTRFEWMLDAIERDDYYLRPEYPERKSLAAGLWITWKAIRALIAFPRTKITSQTLTVHSNRMVKR